MGQGQGPQLYSDPNFPPSWPLLADSGFGDAGSGAGEMGGGMGGMGNMGGFGGLGGMEGWSIDDQTELGSLT